MPTCRRCRQNKPQDEFAVDKRFQYETRHRTICAACDAEQNDKDSSKNRKLGVPWQQDPEILFRLDLVAALVLEGARPYQVAESMGYSWDTAKLDMQRVRILWQQDVSIDLQARRAEAVAEYRYVILRAWEQYRAAKDAKIKLVCLKMVTDAQRQIDMIMGVYTLPDAGDRPINISYVEVVLDRSDPIRVIDVEPKRLDSGSED